MGGINIDGLARQLGLSKSTVSKALNNRSDVGKKTKKRVRALVGRLNYTPNHFARALNFKKSRLVGMLMHTDIAEGFFVQLMKSISNELRNHGYVVVFSSSEGSGKREKDIIEEFMKRLVDATILMPCLNSDVRAINKMIDGGCKLVTVDNYVEGIKAPFIGTDFALGAYLAAKHLIDSGHRTIGYIGGPNRAYSARELKDGYRKAHYESGLKINEKLIVDCEYDESEAKNKFINLKKANSAMTAVHCSQSSIAHGVLSAALDLGLNIPEDISVVSSGSTPKLTSLDQKFDEIGRLATRILLDYLEGEKIPLKSVIAPELVVRNSVKQLP